ncbi:hypothetical protein GCM10010837_32890 [Aminobacter niigataensis]
MQASGAGRREPVQFEFVFELLDELVLVEVLVDELVPVLLWESLSVVQLPLEQLLERELDLLVDLETVTDRLPIRMGALPTVANGTIAGLDAGSGPASAAEKVRTALAKIAAEAKRWNLAIAHAPLRGTPKRHLNMAMRGA